MFEPEPPVPMPPPASDAGPAAGLANPRFVYLVTRLRNRQITMEEATELFALQQRMLADALARPRVTSTPSFTAAGATGPESGLGMVPSVSDDGLAVGLLAMGTAAGLLAAVMKRAQEGPRPPRPSGGTPPLPP